MKLCSRCDRLQPLSEFYKKNGRPHSFCKACFKAYSHDHYLRNADAYKLRTKRRKKRVVAEMRRWLAMYLASHPCVDCGEDDPVVLTFDHVSGDKVACVSEIASYHYSMKKLVDEVEKCVVRCANCHMRKTAKDFNYWLVEYSPVSRGPGCAEGSEG